MSTDPAIQLREDHVKLIGTTQVAAKLIIVAHRNPSEAMQDVGITSRWAPTSLLSSAGLDIPLADDDAEEMDDALHVVEMPERTELGLFFALDGRAHIRVISNSAAAGTRGEELSALVGRLQQAGLLPGTMQLGRARGAVWRPPAGVALEMERHAAKRCLLAGSAGGFAESVTGQTIRPSIESAIIAADIAIKALDSADTQQALMSFRSAWRKKLGSYMGPPSTSLQLLLPLLFVNKSIVARFSRALLHGESI